jgi:hypothetical protein
MEEVEADVARVPERYSVWFRIYLRDHGAALTART